MYEGFDIFTHPHQTCYYVFFNEKNWILVILVSVNWFLIVLFLLRGKASFVRLCQEEHSKANTEPPW